MEENDIPDWIGATIGPEQSRKISKGGGSSANLTPEKVGDYFAVARTLDQDQFSEKYAHPFLIQIDQEETKDDSVRFGTALATRLGAIGDLSDRPGLKDFMVLKVEKRDETLFTQMITVGRAPNNDIPVLDAKTSKFHARFLEDSSGAYTLADGGSTNGTFINGARLKPEEKIGVQDSDILTFGGKRTFVFFTNRGFHRFLSTLPR